MKAEFVGGPFDGDTLTIGDKPPFPPGFKKAVISADIPFQGKSLQDPFVMRVALYNLEIPGDWMFDDPPAWAVVKYVYAGTN